MAFFAGAVTSIVSGYIGMIVAVKANAKVCLACRDSLSKGFVVAFRAGSVMGFCLCSLGLLVLLTLLICYISMYKDIDYIDGVDDATKERLFDNWKGMFESIAGFGLGGSSIALFGRVGGGIYTKAADVGADLVGKVEEDLPEDSPKNPGTIADNVGDNVGDVAGMGADLFGSFAESTSATLVVGSTVKTFWMECTGAVYFPVAICAFGIVACLVTTVFATNIMKIGPPEHVGTHEKTMEQLAKEEKESFGNVEKTLKW